MRTNRFLSIQPLSILVLLLFSSLAVHAASKKANEALFDAIYTGKIAKVKSALAKGADINCKDDIDQTPLEVAVWKKRIDIIRFLVKKGANVNAASGVVGNILYETVNTNQTDIVRILLESGADANVTDEGLGSALMLAVQNKNETMVKLLLSKEGNINFPNGVGKTPLILASEKGYPNIAYDLLCHGANTACKTLEGETALTLATKNNHFDIVVMLQAAMQKPLELVQDTDYISSEDNIRYLIGAIVNNTNSIYKYVEVDVIFLDGNGTQVDSGMSNTANLAGGNIWKFKIPILRDETESYKIVEVKGDK